MKTVNGHDVPSKEEISRKVKEIEKTFAKTAGISNVKSTVDFDNYIITVSCNFSSVAKLNTVVKNIQEVEKSATKIDEQFYGYDAVSKTFSRFNKNSFKKDYQKLSNADKEIFSSANYTFITKFETEVLSSSNKEAKLSASKKAVMLKLNMLDLITEKKSMENKINLTK